MNLGLLGLNEWYHYDIVKPDKGETVFKFYPYDTVKIGKIRTGKEPLFWKPIGDFIPIRRPKRHIKGNCTGCGHILNTKFCFLYSEYSMTPTGRCRFAKHRLCNDCCKKMIENKGVVIPSKDSSIYSNWIRFTKYKIPLLGVMSKCDSLFGYANELFECDAMKGGVCKYSDICAAYKGEEWPKQKDAFIGLERLKVCKVCRKFYDKKINPSDFCSELCKTSSEKDN